MRNPTPFLPGISSLLAGRRRRSERDQLQDEIKQLQRHSLSRLCELFGSWLPQDLFVSAATGPNSRERSFPLSLTFWAFLSQVLDPGSACREVVRKVQAWYAQHARSAPGSGSGAYCQARQRLPVKTLRTAHQQLAGKLMASPASTLWKGRPVRVVDGTGVSMPDTEENRESYSQPSGQQPGCGFPVMKIVGVFCLQTGALLRWVQGTLQEHECRLFTRLIEFFAPGDVVLADRGFSGYGQLAALWDKGVDSLMRLHQLRKVDWRKGRRLGDRDRLVTWQKPYRQTSVFDVEAWAALPAELTLRIVQITVSVPGFRTRQLMLVTTLLDAENYSAEELGRLYFRRWSVEVFYRDIKQTMGMDILRCKSPEMIDKELLMHAIAYNLIRALMADIAASYQIDIGRLSFKGTLDALRQWRPLFEADRGGVRVSRKRIDLFYQSVADDPLILRPDRTEPRVVKRRPKNFRLLTKPRHEMIVEPSRKLSQKPSNKTLV
jgi:hypothetical protein